MAGSSRHWSVQPCSAYKGEKYTRNEWERCENYTPNEWGRCENYTRNEWRRCENYTPNEWRRCENYTPNEWIRCKTTPETSGEDTSGDGLTEGLGWLVGDVAKRIFVME